MSDTPRTDALVVDLANYKEMTDFARTLERELADAKKALTTIACFDDARASEFQRLTGRYTRFDEPGSVEIARKSLK